MHTEKPARKSLHVFILQPQFDWLMDESMMTGDTMTQIVRRLIGDKMRIQARRLAALTPTPPAAA